MAQRQADAANVPLYEVILHAKDYPSMEKAVGKLTAFSDMIEECAQLLFTLTLPDFYEEVLLRTCHSRKQARMNSCGGSDQ